MVSTSQSRWVVAGSTFVLWALVAGSLVYWGLKLAAGPAAPPAPVAMRTPPPADPAAVARLLGFSAPLAQAGPVASVASRFVLLGLVTSLHGEGTALIGVDGKPAKPFAVGASVADGFVLQSVEGRRAVLASSVDGPVVTTLELPRPATGSAPGPQPTPGPIPAPR